MLHTLESHEAEMPNCQDPDCEFHHPDNEADPDPELVDFDIHPSWDN